MSCKTSDGESKWGKECGSLAGLDALLVPRIKKLAACTGAAGKSGKVSGVVTVDFGGNKLGIDVGKSSTVEGPEAIKECLRSDIAGSGACLRTTIRRRLIQLAGIARPAVFQSRALDQTDHGGERSHRPCQRAGNATRIDLLATGRRADRVE